MPSWLTDVFGFECHLGDVDRTDVQFGVPRHGLRRLLNNPELWGREKQDWDLIVNFLQRLDAHPRKAEQNVKHTFWFEFDSRKDGDQWAEPNRSLPNFFFGVKDLPQDRFDAQWTLQLLSELIRGSGTTNKLYQMHRHIERLPPASYVGSIGSMLPRPGQPLRLCIRGLTNKKKYEYLRNLGWSDNALSDLRTAVRPIESLANNEDLKHSYVDLDPGSDSADAKVGLEYNVDSRSNFTVNGIDPVSESVLDVLRSHQLCSPSEYHHLQAWPGYELVSFQDDAHLRIAAKQLNHVKITYQADKGLSAKAYLKVKLISADTLSKLNVSEVNLSELDLSNLNLSKLRSR